ncbi:unnamed protein product [Parnassius apollo]|uniref:(apollo) hypothetical protein n=1 Tax=Parnassius apollo TaxID=110799 RepID=A0A8S3XMK9_PARAO|nr:unnamed protein product [Parnassius apollo]
MHTSMLVDHYSNWSQIMPDREIEHVRKTYVRNIHRLLVSTVIQWCSMGQSGLAAITLRMPLLLAMHHRVITEEMPSRLMATIFQRKARMKQSLINPPVRLLKLNF